MSIFGDDGGAGVPRQHGSLGEYEVETIVSALRVHRIPEGTDEIMRPIVVRSIGAEGRRSPRVSPSG